METKVLVVMGAMGGLQIKANLLNLKCAQHCWANTEILTPETELWRQSTSNSSMAKKEKGNPGLKKFVLMRRDKTRIQISCLPVS